MKAFDNEIWKPIKGYEGLYEISDLGRVRSLYTRGRIVDRENRIIRQTIRDNGYYGVSLHKDKKIKTYYVHRLIACAFIPNPNNFPEVNHIDENKLNNSLNNLEWVSHKYNIDYSHNMEKAIKAISKPVAVHNKQGDFIGEWPSIKAACRDLGVKFRHACDILRGRKYCHYTKGFTFQFI